MNTNAPGGVRKNKVPRCECHRADLTPEQLAETAVRFPVGHQAQVVFLLARHDNNVQLLTTVLGTSAREVRRHARGAPLPPGAWLRRALRRRVLDLVCPGCLADRAVEEAREAERDARRAARRPAGGRTSDR
ncbi:hypothetical protein [Streptomyces sp. UNOB3_S3]|uniref:hypothetical protein n=1 Tax=Streptomyces sp. UNOB3_S3 TaxID=2871682 RepID=UPI001E33C3B2|nr:hypothetical protein [Streptomyces sp. UNOB3_S3]MCC3773312.1 hypothetical protein [Streptomyces sp. UNOB3_S3]